MKGLSIITLSILMALVITPAFLYAETDPASTTHPPLAQPLVREGTLALKLAEVLKVGEVTNEAEAESALSAAGIAPRNGWLGDYPVTPDIVGELQAAVARAADSGRLTLGKDEALGAFQGALAEYGLAVEADTTGAVSAEAVPEAYPDSVAVTDYYYNEGPPVVTYYLPPPDYAYLYSWVPYPFWWWNTWYPGFYVLGDFDVRIGGHGYRHGHRHNHGEFISNHFRDRDTGRMHRIDPAKRSYHGHRDVRSEDRGARVWSNPSSRRGAEAIINRSLGRSHNRSQNMVPERSTRSFVAPSVSGSHISPPSLPAASSPVPAVSRGRHFDGSAGYRGGEHRNSPAFREPSTGSRAISPPSYSGRSFSSPSVGGRGFSGWSERGSSGRGGGGSYGGGRRR